MPVFYSHPQLNLEIDLAKKAWILLNQFFSSLPDMDLADINNF